MTGAILMDLQGQGDISLPNLLDNAENHRGRRNAQIFVRKRTWTTERDLKTGCFDSFLRSALQYLAGIKARRSISNSARSIPLHLRIPRHSLHRPASSFIPLRNERSFSSPLIILSKTRHLSFRACNCAFRTRTSVPRPPATR